MNRERQSCQIAACFAVALLCGCASVKTLPSGDRNTVTRLRPPEQIYIGPFATNDGMWQAAASPPEKRAEIRDWLSGCLLKHLASVAPTQLRGDGPNPSSGWLVTGRFLRVNPGSRVKRLFLGGVGAGASKLETRVDVFDLAVSATEPILSFTTTGGSNLAAGLPGAFTTMEDDVDRTAREIQQHLAARLWPADDGQGRSAAPMAIDEVDVRQPP